MQIFCIKCMSKTNHKILSECTKEYTPHEIEDMNVDCATGTWQILQCEGCERVTFKEAWTNSESSIDPKTGMMEEDIHLYPPRDEHYINPYLLNGIPTFLNQLFIDVVDAYNNKIYWLCAVGIRAIIEYICKIKSIDKGPETDKSGKVKYSESLYGKIEGLLEKKFITEETAKSLHLQRLLGNESIHEFELPTQKELNACIKIAELTIKNIFQLPKLKDEMEYQKSKRKSKKNIYKDSE
jgi:hypothetical protein